MAVSLAAMRVLESEAGLALSRDVQFVAGHSLGEYSALAAAGTFSITDAARLLRIRGRAMQQAVPVGQGAMAAVMGLELDAAAAVAQEAAQGEVCQVANDNGGGQVVLSGHRGAIERAIRIAPERGAKRALLLPVSAPFHCALMAPAAEAMRDALAASPPAPPLVPVLANVSATKATEPTEIARLLVEQVTATVRWRESMLAMAELGVDSFLELGAGKVLTGLARRILPEASAAAAGTPGEIEAVLKQF
jgi:[acyl-carrier-protein] S-malonyltransferase